MSFVSRRDPQAHLPSQQSGCAGRTLPFSYHSLGALLVIADLIVIEAASVLTGTAYHLAAIGSPGETEAFAATGLVVGYIFVSSVYSGGLYRPSRIVGMRPNYRQLLLTWLATFLASAGIAFVLHMGAAFSRGAVLSFMVVGFAGLATLRIAFGIAARRAIARGSLQGSRIVFIGHANALADIGHMSNLQRFGYRIVQSIALPETNAQDEDATAREIVSDVLTFARSNRVDEIVLSLRWANAQMISQVSIGLSRLPLPVRLLPDEVVHHLIQLPTSDVGASIALELQRGPLDAYQRVVKRSFDVLIASIGMLAASPLFLIAAVAIKLDSPGPILFRQRRTGYGGRPFHILKFRTMLVLEDGSRVQQAQRGDDRITWSGSWLRRTSIDELPQLLNVLIGDMSLVGPRPHALAHDLEYDKLIDDYGLRFRVKPGITGWAQVNGFRGETATIDLMMSRIEFDLWYISNWSLWLDIRTLLRTLPAQIRADNAY